MALKTRWELAEGYAYLTNRLSDLEADAQFVKRLYVARGFKQDEFESIMASIRCATSQVQDVISQYGWRTKGQKIGPKK